MSNIHEYDLVERPASIEDERWLWRQYSELLGPSIGAQWGWDEAAQRNDFQTHLPYSLFTIIEDSSNPVACFAVEEDQTRIYLSMLLVAAEHQSSGIGTYILNRLKSRGREHNLPIELSILSANDVDGFYVMNGFRMTGVTDERKSYSWLP